MESTERIEFELGGIDNTYAARELGDISQVMSRILGELAKQADGMTIGSFIPEVVTEEEIKKAQETGGDIMLEKEVEDAIFRGMWIEMGLMEQDMITFGGESLPTERAVEAKLITQEQADELTAPLMTDEQIITMIEGGLVVPMFETDTMLALDMDEHILGNFLIEVGRPDLMDHIIMLSKEEHIKICTELALRATGGVPKEMLTAIKEANEADRNEKEREGEEEDEERACIGGIIDGRTCSYCKSQIGTCGPISELPKPPFHDNCRCEIYTQ